MTAPGSNDAPSGPLVVVVTGLSGAGRTTALHTLEDLGFFCMDNLPTALAAEAVALSERGGMGRVALGLDVRVRSFLGEPGALLDQLSAGGQRQVQVLFLDASDEAILRRFSETRRPHPLSRGDLASAASVLEGVALERERLAPLRARASRVVDTTSLSVHDLRRAVVSTFGPAAEAAASMRVRLVSFGFKFGAPVDADLLFDVRFLDNPHFVDELRDLPGTDPRVIAYVAPREETAQFVEKTLELLKFVLPRYAREGKSYLTIGVGCTGGRHRSVVVTNLLATALGADVAVVHRDVGRNLPAPRPPLDSIAPSSRAPDPSRGGAT